MNNFAIPHRPFAADPFTGMALPDGIFESSIGTQRINVNLANADAGASAAISVYVESISDPGIVVTPRTHNLASVAGGATTLLTWTADFSAATPGAHRLSIIVQQGATKKRIIKKIFVTKVSFNPATGTFSAAFPEGTLGVQFHGFVGPKDACCGERKVPPKRGEKDRQVNLLDYIRKNAGQRPDNFVFCLSQYLPSNYTLTYVPNPSYPGQYSDLPFQDPWWKVLLCIIAVLLLIAAAIAEALDGTGSVGVTVGGDSGGGSPTGDCCGVGATGGGTSYIAAGLVAAAAAVATAAALSDERDPFRRGQDNTVPAAGEITLSERVEAQVSYIAPVALGTPFPIDVKWQYQRFTSGNTYSYEVSETQHNVHVLSKYLIKAPDVVRTYLREHFVVEAQFFDKDKKQLRGGQLFVQCFLVGPTGQYRQFLLQDNGSQPDQKANDGVYTGEFDFQRELSKDKNARGIWTYYVIAQDVNVATPDMTPEQAATIIGGMVVTHQLVIDFEGGSCPFVPDGHVNVV
jgi:hypothetical protein